LREIPTLLSSFASRIKAIITGLASLVWDYEHGLVFCLKARQNEPMRVLALLMAAACLGGAAQSTADIFNRAAAALASGDYSAAESGFLEVLKTSPNHVATLENLGLVYSRTKELDKAIAMYHRALEIDPDNQGVQLNLGLAYMKKASYAEALPIFQSLMKSGYQGLTEHGIRLLYPLASGYMRKNDNEESRRKLAAFLSAAPPAQASLILCKLYYERERFDEALRECRKSLEIDSHLTGAHLELAKVLVSLRNPEATTELSIAIRENPDDPEALYDLGAALLQEDRTGAAVKYLERARQLDPAFWGTYFNLGKAKLSQGLDAEAVPLLTRAAELNPSSFAVFYELGRALLATGQPEKGRRAMQRVRELIGAEMERDARALQKQ
jgi:tetratricopeptide (TPR) repeat protein